MKNKAFTLAEILIVMTIMGILAIVMIQNIKTDTMSEKTNYAKAYKAIEVFDEASANIRHASDADCPLGSLMYTTGKNANGTYDYDIGLNLPDSDKEEAALNIYSKYIKFDKTNLNFCNFSKYCADNDISNLAGARFSNDIYIGLEILDSISDCPDFYMPETEGVITQKTKVNGKKAQCWAKLYIDVNGNDGPNTLGKDIYIFGLDENGINR